MLLRRSSLMYGIKVSGNYSMIGKCCQTTDTVLSKELSCFKEGGSKAANTSRCGPRGAISKAASSAKPRRFPTPTYWPSCKLPTDASRLRIGRTMTLLTHTVTLVTGCATLQLRQGFRLKTSRAGNVACQRGCGYQRRPPHVGPRMEVQREIISNDQAWTCKTVCVNVPLTRCNH
eukprot:502091-Amphidinium_carterae.2